MEFEWDKEKAEGNRTKHAVRFEFAIAVFEDPDRITLLDARWDYAEERWLIIGLVDQVALAVIYTTRGNTIRIISARRAKRNERTKYCTNRQIQLGSEQFTQDDL